MSEPTARQAYRTDEASRARIEAGLEDIRLRLAGIAEMIHALNREWWLDLETGQPVQRNVGESLMLIVSELGEAMEAHRRQARDSHLPGRPGLEVELADALIRLLDFCHGYGLDLAGAVRDKLLYNLTRPDHDVARRRLPGGKRI